MSESSFVIFLFRHSSCSFNRTTRGSLFVAKGPRRYNEIDKKWSCLGNISLETQKVFLPCPKKQSELTWFRAQRHLPCCAASTWAPRSSTGAPAGPSAPPCSGRTSRHAHPPRTWDLPAPRHLQYRTIWFMSVQIGCTLVNTPHVFPGTQQGRATYRVRVCASPWAASASTSSSLGRSTQPC